MAAPPPPPHAPIAVDDDDDDGFDWEAAVRQIDDACARASASASASAPSPDPEFSSAAPGPDPSVAAAAAAFHRPSSGGARQSTLDRFVESFTRRQTEKDRAPPPAAPSESKLGRFVESFTRRQMDKDRAPPAAAAAAPTESKLDRFVESFTRRQQVKERPPPAAAPAGGERRSRRVDQEEASEEPCPSGVPLDPEALQTWIYPTNVEVREYQQYIVQRALFTNTLVALPTGLGKTFIAAAVMYNYFRWFPGGKIVFTAPSRPLVTQQIEACHNTVGIPQEWTIDMKGNLTPPKRASFWKSKRVFFVTPQVLENDIQSGICIAKELVCLVIDEAHKASGNHSYCVAVRELVAACVPLRILALTATPGSKHSDIQGVINNLRISELVHCDENDPKVSRYVQTRTVELLKVPLGSETKQVDDNLLDVIRPHLARLRDNGVIDNRDPAYWSPDHLIALRDNFNQAPPPNIALSRKKQIGASFAVLCSLFTIRKLLLNHGIKPAYQSIEAKWGKGWSWNMLTRDETLLKAKKIMENIISQGVPNPKIRKLEEVLVDHFQKNNSNDSRVIIFSHYRQSVKEILQSLENIDGKLIRPAAFIGQSSAGDRLKGQTQKMQQAILQKFRSGEHNILVATSIGEEGLDIMEVDLVISFDANISPLRMIQRMGRTGRKHEGRVVVLACEGQELKGYKRKQGSARTMKRLLRDLDRFEFHASPRMVPHVYKPEVKYVKLSIEKYIGSKKINVDGNSISPILNKISEEDGELIARYFGACKEDIWKPSLVAFPSFQVSPCDVYKVCHSFRTTDMLIDAMQQLQDFSFFKTKRRNPLQEPIEVPSVKDLTMEGLYVGNTAKEGIPAEYCGSDKEASCGEVAWSNSFCVPSSPIKKYPTHSFFSGNFVTVDVTGYVSITFVPVLPKTSKMSKETENVNWQHKVHNSTTPSKLAADGTGSTVEFCCPADVPYSTKSIFADDELNLAVHSPEYAKQRKHADGVPLLGTPPSKPLTSPRDWDTPCDAKLVTPACLCKEDMELSPRLTHYIEEGIVPESPFLELNHKKLETDSPVNIGFSPKAGPSKSHEQGAQANGLGCQNRPTSFEKKGQFLAGVTELAGSSSANILDQTEAETEETVCPNAKICCPAVHTPTKILLCDSLSDDWHLKLVGDTSGSVKQAPKYRRLCKYGDKIKRISNMSLDDGYDGLVEGQCAIATNCTRNQMGHAIGKKGKAKRCLDTYIDEEVEVSEDADISTDEEDQSEDKYEDSFIDDQTTPTVRFTQSEQGGGNTSDMMAFYRRSLLSQSPVVLPPRYQVFSDSSGSRAGSASCSSEKLRNSIETPQEIPQTHRTIDPSPISYQQSSLERGSSLKEQGEASTVYCESSTKLDCRKRKLSFQQAASTSIPVINIEPEPEPQSSSHLATGTNNDMYWDDAFFESLDLDAIEAQATECWRLKTAESTQKPVEARRASDVSFPPPSFDLGF